MHFSHAIRNKCNRIFANCELIRCHVPGLCCESLYPLFYFAGVWKLGVQPLLVTQTQQLFAFRRIFWLVEVWPFPVFKKSNNEWMILPGLTFGQVSPVKCIVQIPKFKQRLL